MARKPIKPIRFRLYPERRTLYWSVNVWPDRESMRRHLRTLGYSKAFLEDTEGLCRSQMHLKKSASGRYKAVPRLGEINVHRERLTLEVASHEITHAAIFWAERRGMKPIMYGPWREPAPKVDEVVKDPRKAKCRSASADHERFCYALGRMVSQFNFHAWRRKAWPGLKPAG